MRARIRLVVLVRFIAIPSTSENQKILREYLEENAMLIDALFKATGRKEDMGDVVPTFGRAVMCKIRLVFGPKKIGGKKINYPFDIETFSLLSDSNDRPIIFEKDCYMREQIVTNFLIHLSSLGLLSNYDLELWEELTDRCIKFSTLKNGEFNV